MTFVDIGRIIIPVFGLIAMGYVAARLRLFSASVGDALGEFVFALPVPMLIFRTIATAHFPDVSPWPLWISYFTGVIVAWGLGSIISTRLLGLSRAEGVIAGVSSGFSNTVMIGIPLIYTAYGEAGTVPLFLILSVHLPSMMVAGTLLTERAIRQDGNIEAPFSLRDIAAKLASNLITNPIVLSVLAGGAWRLTGFGLEGPPRAIIDQLAAASVPCALFSLGMALRRYGMFGQLQVASLATFLKLVLMPLVVWVIAAQIAGLPPLWTSVATICAGLPAGVNSYLFAVRVNTGQAGASSAITMTSGLSIVTLLIWFNILASH